MVEIPRRFPNIRTIGIIGRPLENSIPININEWLADNLIAVSVWLSHVGINYVPQLLIILPVAVKLRIVSSIAIRIGILLGGVPDSISIEISKLFTQIILTISIGIKIGLCIIPFMITVSIYKRLCSGKVCKIARIIMSILDSIRPVGVILAVVICIGIWLLAIVAAIAIGINKWLTQIVLTIPVGISKLFCGVPLSIAINIREWLGIIIFPIAIYINKLISSMVENAIVVVIIKIMVASELLCRIPFAIAVQIGIWFSDIVSK